MALYLFLLFIVGSAIGSFLNVIIDRATTGESLTGPMRSYCDHCKATLGTVDLVPIISFVGLGGKCRFCKRRISVQYPIVEALTASLFVAAFWVLVQNSSLDLGHLLFWLYLVSTVIVVAVVDFKFSLIPTAFVFAASLVALIFNYFALPSGLFVEHTIAAFGAALFFAVIVVGTRGKGMGQGDIVLGFLMGMVLGVEKVMLAIFLAFLTGAVVSLLLIGFRKKKFGQTVPFAPFLVLGFLIALFCGKELIDWYLRVLI